MEGKKESHEGFNTQVRNISSFLNSFFTHRSIKIQFEKKDEWSAYNGLKR